MNPRFLLTSILLVGVLSASTSVSAGICSWMREKIYTKTLANRNFRTDRELQDYLEMGGNIRTIFQRIVGQGGKWLDGGGGSAMAMQAMMSGESEFGTPSREMYGTTVSLSLPTKRQNPNDFGFIRYQADKHHANLANETEGRFTSIVGEVGVVADVVLGEPGTFDIVTDFMGPASYTLDLAGVLNQYLRLLKTGGSIFIMSVDWALFSREDGIPVDFIGYLNSLPGLSAEKTFEGGNMAFELKKLVDHIEIPEMPIDMDLFRAKNPPIRYFDVVSP